MKFSLRAAALLLAVFAVGRISARAQEAKRYLVSFEEWAGEADRARALRSAGASEVERLDGLDAAIVEVDGARAGSFAEAAALNPLFRLFEEDVYVENWLVAAEPASFYSTALPGVSEALRAIAPPAAPASGAPDSPWADAGEFPWGIQRVNAQAAWARTMGAGVRVAVIDTGIDSNHPDLKGQVVGGYNAVDRGASWFDDNSHGSHVAATIAGALDGKGVVGVAPKAALLAVKVLDKNGGARMSSIIRGLLWCARHDVQVANMSLGSPMGSIFMRLAIKYTVSRGVVVVAAAGNSGGSVGYPAGFGEVIAVSASDRNDRLADFSSRGPGVDFVAPGVDVKSALPGGRWGAYSGTSMASPHVAGLAALAVARGVPSRSVRAALARAARSIGLGASEQGAGLIDAAVLVR